MTMTSIPTVKLQELAEGESARLVSFGNLSRILRHQLMAMGLTRGEMITVKERAPLGDPVCVDIRGAWICLRQDEVAAMQLERCG